MTPRTILRRPSAERLALLPVENDNANSIASKELATETFFTTPVKQTLPLISANLPPSHSSSVTWKSPVVKEKEEFERMRQRVRHIAPQHVPKPNAGKAPSNIFPQNVQEWMAHKKDMLAMAEAENKKNCELLKRQIEAQEKIAKGQRKIVSVFGEGGKVFTDGLSPVLALPSIWSAEYLGASAPWPRKAELEWCGDCRQNSGAKTKCGRVLPTPHPPNGYFWSPFPIDQVGPLFSAGPSPGEFITANRGMDNDPTFEDQGVEYLGGDLMKEVGFCMPGYQPVKMRHRPGTTTTNEIVGPVVIDPGYVFGAVGDGRPTKNGDNMQGGSRGEQQ